MNLKYGRLFFDIEQQKSVWEGELQAEYDWLVASGQTEQPSFESYLEECLGKNGTLIEIRHIPGYEIYIVED